MAINYASPGLVEQLVGASNSRSIYGLCKISQRHSWSDGTQLTPEQYGPDVSEAAPVGTFAEDYEYGRGAADLDQSNGDLRRGRSFLQADMLAPGFYGHVDVPSREQFSIGRQRITLRADSKQLECGKAVRFRMEAADVKGESIRHFEYVHEHGWKNRMWADYSLPCETPTHAHPLGATPVHTHDIGGPSEQVRIITSFPKPGLYKMWAQFQVGWEVVTLPFVLQAAPGAARAAEEIPNDAIRIRVTQHGYEPLKVTIPTGKKVKLAFTRDGTPNCGAEVVFPSLGICRTLPLGGTAIFELPRQKAGEIAFACGMGMYRGMIIARQP